MHSSRMRTGRSLTVCWSLLPGGGSRCGGCLPGPGGSGWGGSPWSQGGVLPARGCVCLVLGGCLPGPGGVCLVRGGLPGPGGFSLVPGGLPGPRGCLPGPGEVCLVRRVLPARGCLPGPGLCLPGPGGFSGDPAVDRITDTCKNITLATTSLRPVITFFIIST